MFISLLEVINAARVTMSFQRLAKVDFALLFSPHLARFC
ncbi:hypothetical protein GGE67_004850 [Rhizobium leucaenae]|uniref:Uncharacterized protein n=1 Tax=Rhizobium leucaenae TaxID=29450 RepID=A0A7W7EPD0_9HYPH|nr:hypothetical protein [Rhizobium leucaenae]MBB6304207.1 hypothetical protein [Rhizobium leucaenae]